MDKTRAQQIIAAKENIDVLFQGTPVWIEGVSDNSVAEVTRMTGSRLKLEVPVSKLEERTQ